jgi:hypothetical protein
MNLHLFSELDYKEKLSHFTQEFDGQLKICTYEIIKKNIIENNWQDFSSINIKKLLQNKEYARFLD